MPNNLQIGNLSRYEQIFSELGLRSGTLRDTTEPFHTREYQDRLGRAPAM